MFLAIMNRQCSIPACAGNAISPASPWLSLAVHPRVCGECVLRTGLPFSSIGSSPRVRGTHPYWPELHAKDRFIPACAGNATTSMPNMSKLPVHPRVCGERAYPSDTMATLSGSSSRVRGTPRVTVCGDRRSRFIPACAGNARRCQPARSAAPVHPRVCGERSPSLKLTHTAFGSSPRVRGTLRARDGQARQKRFIPACAGNACSAMDAP